MNLRRISIISGPFGVGKSEISMNLALARAEAGDVVYLVDLDIVNPYFRSREMRHLLIDHGIEVVSSHEGLEMADLPAISPVVSGALEGDKPVIVDVGGDPIGAKALGRYNRILAGREYDFFLVTNANRPFCRTVEEVVENARSIESASGLALTGIISNTHMMSDTTGHDMHKGIDLSEEASEKLGIPILAVCVDRELAYANSLLSDISQEKGYETVLISRFNDPNRLQR